MDWLFWGAAGTNTQSWQVPCFPSHLIPAVLAGSNDSFHPKPILRPAATQALVVGG